MDKTTRAPRAPARVTPTKNSNNNQFAALAHSDSEAASKSDTHSYIEEAYLPNQSNGKEETHTIVNIIENLDKVSTEATKKPQTDDWSSMSSSTTHDKTDVITRKELEELMEDHYPGVTTPNTAYNYTDVLNFQLQLGNALAKVPAPFQSYGYSYLADTTANYKLRTNKEPPPMPVMPGEPDYTDKGAVRKTKRELNHYLRCHSIRTIGLQILERTFPECLKIYKGEHGLPHDLTIKDAILQVLNSVLSKTERQKEFIRYTDELVGLTYHHEPKSPSLPVYLGELERLRRLQCIVAPSETAAITYEGLMIRAHMRIYEGTGGRRDRIQEINVQWEELRLKNPTWTSREQWQKFKECYCSKMKELDDEGIITSKQRTRANAVVHPKYESFMQHTSSQFDDVREQLDTMSMALSIQTQHRDTENQGISRGIPPVIQAQQQSSATSAVTSDQTIRLLIEERNKHDREKTALQARIKDLEQASNAHNTQPTRASTLSRTSTPDERIIKYDGQGQKWYQVAHYCSKHGYNVSHSNENCRDKNKAEGHQWVSGATACNHHGGNQKNREKHLHWFNPRTKVFAPTIS